MPRAWTGRWTETTDARPRSHQNAVAARRGRTSSGDDLRLLPARLSARAPEPPGRTRTPGEARGAAARHDRAQCRGLRAPGCHDREPWQDARARRAASVKLIFDSLDAFLAELRDRKVVIVRVSP